jgi:hypothetical protein
MQPGEIKIISYEEDTLIITYDFLKMDYTQRITTRIKKIYFFDVTTEIVKKQNKNNPKNYI